MLTSDIQDLILSDFQLLLVLSTCPSDEPDDADHKRRLVVVKEPPINLYHWAVTFGGASKYLEVPGVIYIYILIITWDCYSSNFDGYKRKVTSTLSIKMEVSNFVMETQEMLQVIQPSLS